MNRSSSRDIDFNTLLRSLGTRVKNRENRKMIIAVYVELPNLSNSSIVGGNPRVVEGPILHYTAFFKRELHFMLKCISSESHFSMRLSASFSPSSHGL
jgi:hypothetical protein